MEYAPPPLFNQGVSARARLAFFAFLAIALIVVDARIRVLDTVRAGVAVVLYPVQQVLLAPRRLVDGVANHFASIEQLQADNDALQRERAERARELLQAAQLQAENQQLRNLLSARERLRTQAVLGQVLYEPRDRFTRRLVLDRGSQDGVVAGAPVVDHVGVIGQITRVTPLTSELTLLTDRDQAIPVQIVRNGLRGVAFGGTDAGTLDLRFMPGNADVVDGDLAVTSGLDGVYPPGLPVGKVSAVERSAKDQFARIALTPAAGVASHAYLLVLMLDPAQLLAPPPPAEPERKDVRKGARK